MKHVEQKWGLPGRGVDGLMPQRAYAVRTPIHGPGDPDEVVYVDASTSRKGASKARAQVFLRARDAGFEPKWGDIRVRSLGIRETPHERAERMCAEFNARVPLGTVVRCYRIIPPAGEIPTGNYQLKTVIAPGAFVLPSGYPVVKVPGDAYAIAAVVPELGTVQEVA